MALNKQVVSIPIGGGLDTKNNPVLVDGSKLISIINGRFVKGANGQIQARNGHTALTQALIGGGTFSGATALATLNDELDLIANGELLALSPSQTGWVSRAPFVPCVPSIGPIVRNTYNLETPDAATLNGVTVFAWQDVTRGGVYFKAIDQVDGTVLQDETLLDSRGTFPRVMALPTPGKLAVLWSTSDSETGDGSIMQVMVPTAAATTVSSATAIISSTANGNTPFETSICTPHIGTVHFGIVYLALTTRYVMAATLDTSTLVVVNSTTVISANNSTVTCCELNNYNFCVVAQTDIGSTSTMTVCFLNPTLLTTNASYTESLPSGNVLSCIASPLTTSTVYVYSSIQPPNGTVNYVQQTAWDLTNGFSATYGALLSGCALASTPFVQGTSIYMLLTYVSSIQPTYFLVSAPTTLANLGQLGLIVGRYVSENAGAKQQSGFQRLTHPFSTTSGAVMEMAVTVADALESSGGNPVIIDGVDQLTLDFTQAQARSIQLGQDLSFAGGLPQLYDSESLTENGFNVFPEQMTATLLTSQIGINQVVDGTATSPQSFVLTFPINQTGTGYDGQLIMPGEYVLWYGDNAAYQLWFEIDGQGSAPSWSPGAQRAVPISALNSATEIATQVAAAIVALSASGSTAVVTGNSILVTDTVNEFAERPSTFSLFTIANVANPVHAGTHGSRIVSCVQGNFITPGQWFSFTTYTSGGAAQTLYFWFNVGGVGSDPKPIAGATGVQVNVSTSNTALQVAAAVAAAVPATLTGTVLYTSSPYVQLTDVNLPTATPAVPPQSYPGTVGLALGTVGSGVAANQWDSYEWSAIYEGVDAQGQLGRSAPSVPVQLQIPAYGIGNAQVLLTFNPLWLTARPVVDVAIYRTLTLGQLLYRTSSETSLIYNLIGNATQSFQDSTPDETLQDNDLLYTQPLISGSVIANSPPPAFTQAATFQDQMWINDCEDPQTWWFSKSFASGVQVEFSNEQTLRFDPVIGSTVAAMAMDSNLVVFGTRGIAVVTGEGPDSTGAGAPFSVTYLSTGVGLRDAGSLALTPIGIIFQSAKGKQLLSRGLQIAQRGDGTNWGAPVEAYDGNVVVAAQVIPNTTEVRFTCAGGSSLLYDYQFDQWATATTLGADSIIFGGVFCYLDQSGYIFQEAPGVYEDNGVGFAFSITLAWLKMTAIQGFGRLWKTFIQGFWPANVPFTYTAAYNYLPAIVDNFTTTPVASQTQFRLDPVYQAIESVQFTFTDAAPFSSSQKWSINALDLECGVKRGGYKIGTSGQLS